MTRVDWFGLSMSAFPSIGGQIRRRSEMTRWANFRLMHRSGGRSKSYDTWCLLGTDRVPRGSNCGVDRTDAQSLLPGTNGRFWRKAVIRQNFAVGLMPNGYIEVRWGAVDRQTRTVRRAPASAARGTRRGSPTSSRAAPAAHDACMSRPLRCSRARPTAVPRSRWGCRPSRNPPPDRPRP